MSDGTLKQELQRVVNENIGDVEMELFKREMQRLQSMEVEFVHLRESHKELSDKYDALNTKYEGQKDTIASVRTREVELIAREAKMAEEKTQLHIDTKLLALKLENANLRVEDHKAMVHDIFRGPVFTKSVVESRTYDQAVATNVGGASPDHGHVHLESGLNDFTSTTTTESQE